MLVFKFSKLVLIGTIMVANVSSLNAYEDKAVLPPKVHLAKILERHDKNGDGKISRAEATGGMKHNFHAHDLNNDGFIAGDELDTLPSCQKKPPIRIEKPQR